MGVYGQASVPTTGRYMVKNIYDMAGNVYEWTMESFDDNTRVIRGGFSGTNGYVAPASYRASWLPNEGNISDDGRF